MKGDTIHLRQQALLDFIRDYPDQYPPTVREIGVGVGIGSTTVHYHLTKMVKLGLIERRANCPRCIALTEAICNM